MKQSIDIRHAILNMPRVLQHILFWLAVSFGITLMYSVQTNLWISFRNNLIYMPIEIAYYYAIAYWLIPQYLFTNKYFTFGLLLVLLVIVSVLVTRTMGVLFVGPYLIKTVPVTDADYIKSYSRPFWVMLFDLQNLVNALKGTNLIIGFVLAIKLFKMWYERKQATLEAELNALKAQVHPHFLFNTLNNLYALSLNQSEKSPQLILNLSSILRYMLYECNTDEVMLNQEITMLQQFINLEKLRYEDRLDVTFNIYGDTNGKLIAPLLMLPLIENAFKHGAGEQMGDSWINISLYVSRDELKLKVSNSKAINNKVKEKAGHLGLQNLRKRLELIYPSTYALKIMDDKDTFLAVLDLRLTFAPETKLQLTTHEITYAHS